MPGIEDYVKQFIGNIGRRGAEVTSAYGEFLGHLAEDALQWTLSASSGTRCMLELVGRRGEHVLCQGAAIGSCVACNRPTCLGHAMVSPGRIVCEGCIEAARRHFATVRGPSGAAWAPPPVDAPPKRKRPFGFVDPEELEDNDVPGTRAAAADAKKMRRKHLKALGLDPDASARDVHDAYKRLAFENHPDRARTNAQKQQAQERMKHINEAYRWLQENREAA